MYSIGIDVGSTYTKYCVMSDGKIVSLFMEKTPVRQKEYFDQKINDLLNNYPKADIVSCGYGKSNVNNINSVNELTALARGVYHVTHMDAVVLDIGGQDTKVISQEMGKLKEFFINDKCAAGSGVFLTNTLNMLGMSFEDIHIGDIYDSPISLLSTCAVFAQSEMVELIADNRTEEEIIRAVLRQIFVKAKPLLSKVEHGSVMLSGGLSQIERIKPFAENVLETDIIVMESGAYYSSIGCAI